MQFKEFSLIAPVIESTDVFKAIETVISPEVIEQTIGTTKTKQERKRKLPSSLVVCLVIAMSLWSSDSMTAVLKNLVNGLSRQWTKLGKYWRVPNSASISEARQRVGCRVMSQLFARIVRPMATPATPGAFLGGLRVDGSRWHCLRCTGFYCQCQSLWLSRFWSPNQSGFSKSSHTHVDRGRDTFNRRCLNLSLPHG